MVVAPFFIVGSTEWGERLRTGQTVGESWFGRALAEVGELGKGHIINIGIFLNFSHSLPILKKHYPLQREGF